MQVKVPRVAYVFVGQISPQLADNSPKLLHKQAPLLKKPPFQTLASIFGVEPKRRRENIDLFVDVFVFFCHQNYEGPRPEMTTEMTASSAYPRFTRDESRNHQGGASRMRGCHQAPEGKKRFSASTSLKGPGGWEFCMEEG